MRAGFAVARTDARDCSSSRFTRMRQTACCLIEQRSFTKRDSTQKEKPMKSLYARFMSNDEGQDLIEYGLLIGIITAAAITAILAIGPKVSAYFTTLEGNLP
jgi:pilus assembly protein Flp/PilA